MIPNPGSKRKDHLNRKFVVETNRVIKDSKVGKAIGTGTQAGVDIVVCWADEDIPAAVHTTVSGRKKIECGFGNGIEAVQTADGYIEGEQKWRLCNIAPDIVAEGKLLVCVRHKDYLDIIFELCDG